MTASQTGSTEPQDEASEGNLPNPETGIGIGEGKASTFEPEEDPAGDIPEDSQIGTVGAADAEAGAGPDGE